MPGFGPVLEELPGDVVPRAPCSGCPASNKSYGMHRAALHAELGAVVRIHSARRGSNGEVQ